MNDKLICDKGHPNVIDRDDRPEVIGGLGPCSIEGCGGVYGYKKRHPYIRRMMNRVALHIRWDNSGSNTTDCGTDATPLDTSS